MKKYLITVPTTEYPEGIEIEVITNNIQPKIFGKFKKVTKRVIPMQPNIYRAYGLEMYKNTEDYKHEIIIGYGYPDTAYAENNTAYTKSGKKIGNLGDLPNLINHTLEEFL